MRICSIGECMVELSNSKNKQYSFGYAGDTANSAIYFSRLGASSSYITSVGNDILSKKMVKFLGEEKVKTNDIYVNKKKSLGLYLIQNKSNGEKNFFYWRSNSSAKFLFDNINIKSLSKNIIKCDAIYFSGITLSIYNAKNLLKFYKLLTLVKKNGVKVYFDFNVRIRNWMNLSTALKSIKKFSKLADIILMTEEDLKSLGLNNYKKTIIKYFKNKTVIFRSSKGEINVFIENDFKNYKLKFKDKVKDTTGCGDAFNAGFLFNYFNKNPIKDCLFIAHNLAKDVAQTKGAIINKKIFKNHKYVL